MFSFSIFGKKKPGGASEQGTTSTSALESASRSRPRDQLKDQAKEWKSVLRKEIHEVKRKERQLQRNVDETKAICKAHLKAGRRSNALQLVTPIKNAQDGVQRLKLQVVSLESAISRIDEQVSMALITSTIKMSADMSREMMRTFNAREMSHTVKKLADEMQKAGILQEILHETIDDEFVPVSSDERVAEEIAEEFLAELEVGGSVSTSTLVKDSEIDLGQKKDENGLEVEDEGEEVKDKVVIG